MEADKATRPSAVGWHSSIRPPTTSTLALAPACPPPHEQAHSPFCCPFSEPCRYLCRIPAPAWVGHGRRWHIVIGSGHRGQGRKGPGHLVPSPCALPALALPCSERASAAQPKAAVLSQSVTPFTFLVGASAIERPWKAGLGRQQKVPG